MLGFSSPRVSFSQTGTQQQQLLPNDFSSLLNRLGQELSCAICLNIYNNPVSSPCNHYFCRDCLERMLRVGQRTDGKCPICKLRVTRRTIVEASMLGNLAQAFLELASEYERTTGKTWDEVEGASKKISHTNNSLPSTLDVESLVRVDIQLERELAELDELIEKRRNELKLLPEADTLAIVDNLEFPSSPDEDLFVQKDYSPIETPYPLIRLNAPDASPSIVLSTSLIKGDQLEQVMEFAKKFECPIVTKFDWNVTHLIAFVNADGISKRTLKYMRCLLMGSWILSIDWINSCLRAGKIVPEAPFEVKGDEYYPDDQGPHRSKISRQLNESPLFSGFSFFLYGKFSSPTQEELELLISDGGGNIIYDIDELKRKKGKILVLCDPREQSDFERYSGILVKFRPLLSSFWLLDCISAYQLVDTGPHVVL